MKHKKVELTELFYDLVYVYAISQVTSLIHHVHHGFVTPSAFFTFAMGLIIYVNSWMVQSVYTNRFGKNSLTNILMMFFQMVCLMISSTAITGDWSRDFIWFILPTAGISLLLLGQYVLSFYQTKNLADKRLIKQFFYILGIRSAMLLLSACLPYQSGLPVATIGILLTWLLPAFLVSPQTSVINAKVTPINFPHLIERLSLLVIITFGEMIIGIADYFMPENLSVYSFLAFLIVSNLFMIYIVEIDHCINDELTGVTGNKAIYAHYPIFAGLSLVTVSLGFLSNQEAKSGFAFGLMLIGLLLFMLGLFSHNSYNKSSHYFTRSLVISEFGFLAVTVVLCTFVLGNWHQLMLLIAIATTVMMVIFVNFNVKRMH